MYEVSSLSRLTPMMFTRPHPCARISAGGLLVCVEPSYPHEGQKAQVEVHSLAAILRDTRESQELEMLPGPLKPGVTNKNNVIKFCERKIAACRGNRDMADKESYILVWDHRYIKNKKTFNVSPKKNSIGRFFSPIFLAQTPLIYTFLLIFNLQFFNTEYIFRKN